MYLLYFFFIIIGIIILILLIFGLPRNKSDRRPNIEGLDSPEVVKAFEKVTNFIPFKILRKKVVSEIRKYSPEGKLIDLGCGSGNLIVKIAHSFPYLDLFGMDISSEMLNLANMRAEMNGLTEKIEFKGGSVENLPFPDDYADFIVSTLSLHHWIDPEKAIGEIFRILKKGGTALIFDFRRDSRKIFYDLLTFATKVVVPKPLKEVNEPLGSIQSSYTLLEAKEMLTKINSIDLKINSYVMWMFIEIKK